MTITADRNTQAREGECFSYPMATATHLYAGQMVGLDTAGNAVAMSLATGLVCVGRAEEEINNTGAAAAKSIKVKQGVFKWDNHGSVTKTSIGDTVYAYDDVAVQASSSGASAVGVMVDIESDGVWVETKVPATLVSGFAVANNLSEGTASTMRTNLGLGTIATQAANSVAISGGSVTGITDLAIADGGTAASTAAAARTSLGVKLVQKMQVASLLAAAAFYIVAPVAGTIAKIWSALNIAALATGDAVLTFAINGTPITTGAITITQAGSAAGDKDSCTPTALNVVAAGDVISCTVTGTNSEATAWADVQIEINP